MKMTAIVFVMLIPSMIFATTAGYLAINDKSFGWFLFAAILCSCISFTGSKKKTD